MATKGNSSIEKALALLLHFKSGGKNTYSLQELALMANLNKATTLRFLISMETMGFVEKTGPGNYGLGTAALQLSNHYRKSYQLSDHVVPVLRHLVSTTGQTAAFWVRRGEYRVCLHMVQSETALSNHLSEGSVRPYNEAATGQILQAFSDSSGSFETVQKNYYVLNFGERHPLIASIAVPVFKTDEKLVGAMSVSGPINDFVGEKVSEYLRELFSASITLTERLGGDTSELSKRLLAHSII